MGGDVDEVEIDGEPVGHVFGATNPETKRAQFKAQLRGGECIGFFDSAIDAKAAIVARMTPTDEHAERVNEATAHQARFDAMKPAQSNADVMAASVKRIKQLRLAALIADGDKVLTSRADALELVATMPQGALFYIRIYLDAALPAKPDKCIPDAFSSSLQITRAQAETIVGDMFHAALEKRGAALEMRVGTWARERWNKKARGMIAAKPRRVLWIG